MVLTNEQKRVRDLLTETVTLLCKNGLQFKSEIGIEALIGITLDRDEVFLVSIKETISSAEELSNESLLSLGSINKSVDDIEFVANTDIFESNGTNAHKKPAQPASKVRRIRRNSRSRADIREKLSILKSETVVEEIAKSETLEQLSIARTHRHSKSRRFSYAAQPSEIEILNSFTIAATEKTVKFDNESTDLVELAMEAQNSNDSCIIDIKQEHVDEEYNPYTEFDSLCANSTDELNGVDWKPDNERSSLSHSTSRDQLFPLQKKRRQNFKSHQNNAVARNSAGAGGKTVESDAHRCPICGSVSPNWNVYLHHIRKHQPGLYRCPFCGKSFSGSTNLRGHLAVHTNVREFACHLCEKDYAYKKDLTEHLILKHGHIVTRTSLTAPSGLTGKLSRNV